jgi:hypothetical protein
MEIQQETKFLRIVLLPSRVIQEEWSIQVFWGRCEKKFRMIICLILNHYGHRVVWIPFITSSGFCLWDWMRTKVCKTKLDTREELLALILNAAARIKKSEDQLRRTTRDLRTRVAKWTEVDGGIFEHSFWTVTNSPILCNRFFF